jgi:hypothetical protein
MNKEIISLIADYNEGDDEKKKLLKLSTGYEFYKKDEIVKEFYYFLYKNGFVDNENFTKDGHSVFKNGKFYPVINGTTKSITINVAGKNFGTFDKPFLENLPWWQKLIKVRQRLLDPSILYVDWENDETLPNLDGCKERANIKGLVTHDCLEDAWDVVLTLRNKY